MEAARTAHSEEDRNADDNDYQHGQEKRAEDS